MQPTLVAKPFHRAGWTYEEKYDGWRMAAYKREDQVQLISRPGRDHTRRFPALVAATAVTPAGGQSDYPTAYRLNKVTGGVALCVGLVCSVAVPPGSHGSNGQGREMKTFHGLILAGAVLGAVCCRRSWRRGETTGRSG
jgi:hypothetical protein